MFKVLGVLVAGCAVLVAAAPARADVTPDGPATIVPDGRYACTAAYSPSVLMGWRVTVGEGSRAGTVRPLLTSWGTVTGLGEPVELPATPGVHLLPAPRVPWTCGDFVGIAQSTGAHAIVSRADCRPEAGHGGPCKNWWLTVGREGQADERIEGARLAIEAIGESDWDTDLLGDVTEDRTDLRAQLRNIADLGDRIVSTIVVANAGPLAADLLTLEVLRPDGFKGTWQQDCRGLTVPTIVGTDRCAGGRLAAGESREFTYVSDRPAEGAVRIVARSEGEDLAPADNETGLVPQPFGPILPRCVCAAPTKTEVSTARRHTLRRGVKVKVRGDGPTRVTAAFKARGKTVRLARTMTLVAGVERTVTLRAHGAKLRTLRRATARGPLKATITVRNAHGTATATARVT